MTGIRLVRVELSLAWAAAAALSSIGGGLLIGASPMLALDLAIVCAAAVLLARRPYAALIALILVFAAPREFLTFLVVCAGTLALITCAPSLPGKRFIVPLLFFLLLAVPSLSLLPSPDEGFSAPYLYLPFVGTAYIRNPSFEFHEWLNLGSVLIVFCMAAWAVRSRKQLGILLATVLVSSVVAIVTAFAQLATGETFERTGSTLASIRGPFSHPNYFAFYLIVVLALAIMVFFEASRLDARLAVGVLIASALFCLFLTYTRSAWIGFALILAGMAVLRYRKLLILATIVLVLAVLVAPGAAREAQQRFGDLSSKSQANDQNSWRWRVDQWAAVLPYGFAQPLTGQGFDSYPRLTVRRFGHSDARFPTVADKRHGVYSPLGFTAHNDYVKTFVELGVPGLLLWLLTLWGLAATAWRARRLPGVAGTSVTMVATVAGLAVISASDNLQGYTVVLAYIAAVCGGLAGVTANASRRIPEPVPSRPRPLESAAQPAEQAEPELEPLNPVAPEPDTEPSGQSQVGDIRARARAWVRRRQAARS